MLNVAYIYKKQDIVTINASNIHVDGHDYSVEIHSSMNELYKLKNQDKAKINLVGESTSLLCTSLIDSEIYYETSHRFGEEFRAILRFREVSIFKNDSLFYKMILPSFNKLNPEQIYRGGIANGAIYL